MHHTPRHGRLLPAVLALLAIAVALPPNVRAQNAADAFTPFVAAFDLTEITTTGGVLWIATNGGGALRFDPNGGGFTQYPKLLGTGPRGNDLVTTCVDSEGRVWFGSATRGFTFFDPQTQTWDRRSEEWPDPRIRVIRCLEEGVYIGTQEGLSLKPTANRTDICAPADPSCIVPSFIVNDYALLDESLWVATREGLGRFSEGTWDSLNTLPVGSQGQNSLSLVTFEGQLWEAAEFAASTGAVRRLVDGAWQVFELPAHRLRVLDGSLYAIAAGDLFRWDGTAFQPLSEPVDDDIRDVALLDGVYWLTTGNGLVSWNGTAATSTRFVPPGLGLGGEFQALTVDSKGTVWAGTIGNRIGIASRTRTGEWDTILPGASGLENEWIFQLYADSGDRLWIGHCCCPEGRCRLEVDCAGGIGSIATYRNGWAFAEDNARRMWVGTDQLGALVFRRTTDCSWELEDQLTASDPAGVMSSNSVRAIAVTGEGTYFGHLQNGLDYWPHRGNLSTGRDGSNWIHVGTTGFGLLDNNVGSIALVGEDAWVGTSSGLHRFRAGGLVTRCPSRILDDLDDQARRVTAVTVDRDGNLWVGTDSGLLFLRRGGACDAGGGEFLSYTQDNSALPDNNVLSATLNPVDGSVWMGTSTGLLRIDPAVFTSGGGSAPDQYVLYPNPVDLTRVGARVSLGLESGGSVDRVPLADAQQPEVLDMAGQAVGRFDTFMDGGDEGWVWNGKNLTGSVVAPGLYFVRTQVGGQTVVLKLGVVR